MFKKTNAIRSILALFMVYITGCNSSVTPTSSGTQTERIIAAQIGSHRITQADIDAEFRALPASVKERVDEQQYKQTIRNTLVQRAILSQKASELGLDQNPDLRRRIQRNHDSLMIEALMAWKRNSLAPPSDTQIQTYYQQHTDDFTIPEQMHARHILLRERKRAQELYRQLTQKKANFDDLVMHYSIDDSNKARGGDLNWFPRGVMLPSFEQAAFALKQDGDISRPVHTKFGWHIIQRLGYRPKTQAPLAEVRDEIIQILQQQALDQWIKQLVQHNTTNPS